MGDLETEKVELRVLTQTFISYFVLGRSVKKLGSQFPLL